MVRPSRRHARESVTLTRLSAPTLAIQSRPVRLLVVGPKHDWPIVLREMIASHTLDVVHAADFRQACEPSTLAAVDAVFLCAGDEPVAERERDDLRFLCEALAAQRLMALVTPELMTTGMAGDDAVLSRIHSDLSPDELWGRVDAARLYRPLVRRMDEHVGAMQRLGKKLNQHFVEVDQELRLASRLQRDFLPKTLPQVNDLRFAVLYRPATWVSGDVYDVRRLDETHIALYLADAVGHGVAAGLLTMFLRQSICGKRIHDNAYTIVPPGEVLANLNRDMADQELPNCQFVTACYATISTETGELNFARGGHPHPIHVRADGQCIETRTTGGLLGVFPDEEFVGARLILAPGEKFILYSDGMEDVMFSRRDGEPGPTRFTPEFQEAVTHPADDCLRAIDALLNQTEGSLSPLDDQTCVIVERMAH